MGNNNEKKIELTFSKKNGKTTVSSVMNKDLTVYEVVNSLIALSDGLKNGIADYACLHDIAPEDEDFEEIIKKITIQDLQK